MSLVSSGTADILVLSLFSFVGDGGQFSILLPLPSTLPPPPSRSILVIFHRHLFLSGSPPQCDPCLPSPLSRVAETLGPPKSSCQDPCPFDQEAPSSLVWRGE